MRIRRVPDRLGLITLQVRVAGIAAGERHFDLEGVEGADRRDNPLAADHRDRALVDARLVALEHVDQHAVAVGQREAPYQVYELVIVVDDRRRLSGDLPWLSVRP